MTCVTSISESSAMNDTEKIKMYLNIGGCQIPVTVPYSQQELNRDVEKQVEIVLGSKPEEEPVNESGIAPRNRSGFWN